ncbi:MAG: PKD domain-containing protein, partial [Verrucomicrobia bacterium]|nr:PKD domain-containing protein [Verrucomicrobiota bacterium]
MAVLYRLLDRFWAPLWVGVLGLTTASPLAASSSSKPAHPQRIITCIQSGVSSPKARNLSFTIAPEQRMRLLRSHVLELEFIQVWELPPDVSPDHLAKALQKSGACDWAEPDRWITLQATSATLIKDPQVQSGQQWHLNNTGQNGGVAGADIRALEAWETRRYASNMIVAVIDTGVRYTHQDLRANMWVNLAEIPGNGIDDDRNGYVDDVHGINAAENNGNPWDLIGHGTQVAGLIGGSGGNSVGGAGVAWSVQLMVLRFFDSSGRGSVSDVIECFDYARKMGASIINASFGDTNDSRTLLAALRACRNAGIIVSTGAGNGVVNIDLQPFYPAAYDLDNLIVSCASTRHDTLASLSNFGRSLVDLAAPGDEMVTVSAAADDAYTVNRGTSFSTAVVSGALALMKAHFPGDSYRTTIQKILASVDRPAGLTNASVTGGRLNLATALGPSVSAEFSVQPGSGSAPLSVTFNNTSLGEIASWRWDFGDGTFATTPNPSHAFLAADDFSVVLEVESFFGRVSRSQKQVMVTPSAGNVFLLSPQGKIEIPAAASQGMPVELLEPTWQLANEGQVPVAFSSSTTVPWLSVVPDSGVVGGGGSQALSLRIDPSILVGPPGIHEAHVIVAGHHRRVLLQLVKAPEFKGIVVAENKDVTLQWSLHPGAKVAVEWSGD